VSRLKESVFHGRPVRFSPLARVERIVHTLSPFEKLVFIAFVLLALAGSLALLYSVHATYLSSETPTWGGELTEGIIGFPRFVNPLLAVSDADRDITALVFSGLMRSRFNDSPVPDLAESYTVSEDKLVYTFTIREGAVFHDGTPVTADDVVFTIRGTQDPALKSPRRANWDGVLVEKVDDRTVSFTLPQPYGAFLENATIGILPAHIWRNISPDEFPFSALNTEPVGAGPYSVSKITRDHSGVPTSYTLESFTSYAPQPAYIETVTFSFFSNETAAKEAYERGTIDSLGGLSPNTQEGLASGQTYEVPLARTFAIFFNLNVELFTNIEVRKALEATISSEELIEEILAGRGTPLLGPVPPGIIDTHEDVAVVKTREERLAQARAILERNGWEQNEDGVYENEGTPLSFTLSTLGIPELSAIVEKVAKDWGEMGADVTVQIFDQSDLTQSVIRPRRFDTLLFGQVVGREVDLFAFWHSSQRNDPGLNIASYANITVDRILERMRRTEDREELAKEYSLLKEELTNDSPAIFLYAPNYTYTLPESVRGVAVSVLSAPYERFLDAPSWFITTKRVWHFFANN